jgi:cytochrome c oxidase assembly protein subunit 15
MQQMILKKYRQTAIFTIYAFVLLILVGGIVRSTGSGMGCPDWPKCFGTWIPPTDVSQLPADYKTIYLQKRLDKNARIAHRLEKMGWNETARKILTDKSIQVEESFNSVKTWIEYLNRLLGVLIGLFIFATLLRSLPFRKTRPVVFWLSLMSFIGVGIEGWLGSIVVSTNLMPGIITAHLGLAMLILLMLLTAVLIADEADPNVNRHLTLRPMPFIGGGIGVSILIFIQMMLGTQVREQVDRVAVQLHTDDRSSWIAHLGTVYDIHRFSYYLLAAAVLYWVWNLRQRAYFENNSLKNICFLILISLSCEILLGIGMARWAIPPAFQPLHLLFATLLLAGTYTATGILYWRKITT